MIKEFCTAGQAAPCRFVGRGVQNSLITPGGLGGVPDQPDAERDDRQAECDVEGRERAEGEQAADDQTGVTPSLIPRTRYLQALASGI